MALEIWLYKIHRFPRRFRIVGTAGGDDYKRLVLQQALWSSLFEYKGLTDADNEVNVCFENSRHAEVVHWNAEDIRVGFNQFFDQFV